MTNPFTALLSGGIGTVFSGAKDIINQFVASPEQKLTATQKLAELETGYREKQIEAERDFAEQQAKVIVAEAQSDSWLARNWRPITMLTFVAIIVWNYVVVGTIGAFFAQVHAIPIPPDMWRLLDIGIGGYIGARSAEKIADTVSDAVTAAKKQ